MPSLRTTITELGTGLGMLGYGCVDEALSARPPEMVSVSPETWERLQFTRKGGAYDLEFDTAFDNGKAFLSARDGLRQRRPLMIEWKGSHRAPGDEVAPIDLRVDHVYLVSCKYLSKILLNASPFHLFDNLLAGPHGRRGADWYEEVAPAEYDALYQRIRCELSASGELLPAGRLPLHGAELPVSPSQLSSSDREVLRHALSRGWPGTTGDAYRALANQVSKVSAARWSQALEVQESREPMLWRLLRMNAAPYFVLGAAPGSVLRLRIATPWDWRQRFRLESFDVAAQSGGQSRVGWAAVVRDRTLGGMTEVRGHVEVRWSHGRFGGPPEAKCYLDSSHGEVPGYFSLC